MTPGPPSAPPSASAAPAPAGPADGSRRGPSWLLPTAVTLLVMLLVRGLLVQSFYVPSASMEPTIRPGDRILVDKTVRGDDIARGDVVVFDGASSFGLADRGPRLSEGLLGRLLSGAASLLGVDLGEQAFVKRVVGLPGDRVACCDDRSRLTVNGRPVEEGYLAPGTRPSETTFDVTVPAGRLWVMGDNRSTSADSRAHLGRPGGGTVRVEDLIGRASSTYWPLSRLGRLTGAPGLRAVPVAGAVP